MHLGKIDLDNGIARGLGDFDRTYVMDYGTVSMLVPVNNTVGVQVMGAEGGPAGADYSLISVNLTTGNQDAAPFFIVHGNETLQLRSLMFDEATNKTYCFASQIDSSDPTGLNTLFGTLTFSYDTGIGRAEFTLVGEKNYTGHERKVNSVVVSDQRVVISAINDENDKTSQIISTNMDTGEITQLKGGPQAEFSGF